MQKDSEPQGEAWQMTGKRRSQMNEAIKDLKQTVNQDSPTYGQVQSGLDKVTREFETSRNNQEDPPPPPREYEEEHPTIH